MKAVKGWGGFHLWRGVQGGEPKGGQPSMIDCGDRLQGSEGERLRGAMSRAWNFPTVSAGEKLKEKKLRDFVTVASLKR